MIIRKIEHKDLQDLAKLYEKLSEEVCPVSEMEENFKYIAANPEYYLLGAEVDGKIVGTVMGIVCYDLVACFKHFMTVENVIVDEQYRGYGIGKSLFGALEKVAKERNCTYIYLVSGPKRTVAHQMYRALGYADEGALGFRKYID